MEPAAKMLEVFLADVQLQHFFDHWQEVCQRSDRSQWRRLRRTDDPPRRCQHERVLHHVQRHSAFEQLQCQQTVRTAHDTRRAWRRAIRFQDVSNILGWIDR